MLKKTVAAALLALFNTVAFAKPVQINDILNRKVTVDLPAKRVVLGFYYQDYLAIGGKDAMNNVVGFSKDVWSVWTPDSWALYRKAIPKLNTLSDVGEVETGTFSIEKVLSLKPDLVIPADWQYQALGSDLARLEKAKIPVVVLDYNAQTLAKHLKSTQILGTLTGRPERAKTISDEYKNIVSDIDARLKKARLPKPKIYIEFGNKGPKEYSVSFGKSMWGAMATLAGGNNISAPYIEFYGSMSPEKVLAAKPDVVVITGRETELNKNKEAMVMGVGIPSTEAQRRLNGFKQRAGWAQLPAVKNNRVYGAYHAASRTMLDQAMIQFLAKAMYPKVFADVNPEKTYLDFHRKYLPVVLTGTFMLYPQNQ